MTETHPLPLRFPYIRARRGAALATLAREPETGDLTYPHLIDISKYSSWDEGAPEEPRQKCDEIVDAGVGGPAGVVLRAYHLELS